MRQIDIDEVRRLRDEENARLVEVLGKASYAALHLPGATSLPLATIDATSTAGFEIGLPIVAYCYDHQ